MSRLAQFHGRGEDGLDGYFPDGAPVSSAPWPRAGSSRGATNPIPHLQAAIRDPEYPVTDVDPLDPRLRSVQPQVTRAGVQHYLRSDSLYADQNQAGNQTPILWRTRQGNGDEILVAHSGTHRGTAAGLKGQQFAAKIVSDPRYVT